MTLTPQYGVGSITRIEMIKTLRKPECSQLISDFLNIPAGVKQEDGTRDEFEHVYQLIDTDNSKHITKNEWCEYFYGKWAMYIFAAVNKKKPAFVPKPEEMEVSSVPKPLKS